MRGTALLLAAAAFFASPAADATLTVYTSQTAFTAATTAPGVDSYTGFTITGSTSAATSLVATSPVPFSWATSR